MKGNNLIKSQEALENITFFSPCLLNRILFEKKATNTIEFENLVTAERREVRSKSKLSFF